MPAKRNTIQQQGPNPFIQIAANLKKQAINEGITGSVPSIFTLPVHIAIDNLFRTDQDYFIAGEPTVMMEVLTEGWKLKGYDIPKWYAMVNGAIGNNVSGDDKAAFDEAVTILKDYNKDHRDQYRAKAIEVGKQIKDALKKPVRLADLSTNAEKLGPEVNVSMSSISDKEKKVTWANWNDKDLLTRAGRENSFYIDIYGLPQAGKTNLGYLLASQALGQDRWIYTNLKPPAKLYKLYPRSRYYMIRKISDLFIDTPEHPSILRVHLENADRLLRGYRSEIGSVIIFDEAKMSLAGNANAIEGRAHASFMQIKRHIGYTGVIYLGVLQQTAYFEDQFETMKIECKSRKINEFDMVGRQRSRYSFNYVTKDNPLTAVIDDIPPAELRPSEILGPDLAIGVEFDMDVAQMFKEVGEAPGIEDTSMPEIYRFIAEMGKYILKTANYARRRQGMDMMKKQEIEESITEILEGAGEAVKNGETAPKDGQPVVRIPNEAKQPENNEDIFLR